MHASRRSFLKKSALALASTALLKKSMFAGNLASEVTSIQLYSIREDMKKDPMGSLKQVAEMGYKYVEHANYINRKFYGWEAKEFRKILDDLGMKMYSGHTVLGKQHWDAAKKDFTDEWKYTVEDAATMGQKFVISPWFDAELRKTYDDTLKFLEVFNKSGELCKKSGMKFGYHNHDFEFSAELNGQKVYDIIMKNTDPNLVSQQLDMGNMVHAGANAADILAKYPGRFETIHVKDEIKSKEKEGTFESTILGDGFVKTREVTQMSVKSGGSWLLVIEQESYQSKTPMQCIKEDLAIMKKWGY
jgi:sugar phosphate isomerase/epimerase